MNRSRRKRKMVPMYSAEDFFSGKKDAKPVGMMSDPDEMGPIIVDQKTWEMLTGYRFPGNDTVPASDEVGT